MCSSLWCLDEEETMMKGRSATDSEPMPLLLVRSAAVCDTKHIMRHVMWIVETSRSGEGGEGCEAVKQAGGCPWHRRRPYLFIRGGRCHVSVMLSMCCLTTLAS